MTFGVRRCSLSSAFAPCANSARLSNSGGALAVQSELEKWSYVQPEIGVLNDFLDWCEQQKIELAVPRETGNWWAPVNCTRTTLLYRYFGIDMTKLEDERRAVLARTSTRGA